MEDENKLTLNNILFYLLMSMLAIVVVYNIVTTYHIDKYGSYANGLITDISDYGSKAMFIYNFELNGKQYKGTATVSMFEKYPQRIGDSCIIKYNTNNPNLSRLIKNKDELIQYYRSKIKIEE